MIKPDVNPDRIAPYLRELAEEIILPRYNSLSADEKRHKSPGDLVTIVDIEMEERLNKFLPDILPGSVVIGEEAVSENPDLLKTAYKEDLVWLVDPLDGTNNFVHGRRAFCVMVALHFKGEVIMSCIYDPLGKKTVTAMRGQGAFANDEKLNCSSTLEFNQMHGQINYRIVKDEEQREKLKEKAAKSFAKLDRLGCAGHDLIHHAEGNRHFSLYSRLAPWDFAPGGLILEEAGGILKNVDGSKLKPFDYAYGLLTASNEENWDNLRSFLMD